MTRNADLSSAAVALATSAVDEAIKGAWLGELLVDSACRERYTSPDCWSSMWSLSSV
jgi:hypothetical protein